MENKPPKKLARALAAVMLAAAMVLCSAPSRAADERIPSAHLDYIIGPEDVLEISVWKNPDLSKTVMVRPDGKISLPLIGDVRASGLTPEELRENIVAELGKYQQTVVASVIVDQINSYKVFVFGEVASPGVFSLKRRTSLVQAIAMAGGFNQFASRNDIIVLREADGEKSERMAIRFDDIVYSDKSARKNIILKPGDTVFVP